jgi:CO/xanthine dehydrogenase Mo-binding subunit
VHTAVRHDSAVAHVTGAARYLDDVPTVAGTLEAALVLSPHAHARIRRIDLSAALDAPGVVAAITAADIPGKNDIAPIRNDEPALAAGVVEYEGQPLAAIAAATLDQARAAAKLAAMDYEPLASVLTVEEAMARESYVSPPQLMLRGEVEPALASAVKGRSRSPPPAKTATCTCGVRRSIRPKSSTGSRIFSACRLTPSRSRCGAWAARSAARRARPPSSPALPPCSPGRRGDL